MVISFSASTVKGDALRLAIPTAAVAREDVAVVALLPFVWHTIAAHGPAAANHRQQQHGTCTGPQRCPAAAAAPRRHAPAQLRPRHLAAASPRPEAGAAVHGPPLRLSPSVAPCHSS